MLQPTEPTHQDLAPLFEGSQSKIRQSVVGTPFVSQFWRRIVRHTPFWDCIYVDQPYNPCNRKSRNPQVMNQDGSVTLSPCFIGIRNTLEPLANRFCNRFE